MAAGLLLRPLESTKQAGSKLEAWAPRPDPAPPAVQLAVAQNVYKKNQEGKRGQLADARRVGLPRQRPCLQQQGGRPFRLLLRRRARAQRPAGRVALHELPSLEVYCDASWRGRQPRDYLGLAIMLGGAAISACSKRIKLKAQSSEEKALRFVQQLLKFNGYSLQRPHATACTRRPNCCSN